MDSETLNKEEIYKTARRWSLLTVKHTSYVAAQAFAFCACKLDDLRHYTDRKLEE